MAISTFPAASSGGKSERTVIITSTQSWTAPSDVTTVDLFLVGGGGGGGATNTTNNQGAGAGGGGQVLQDTVSVTPGASYTVTIGAGGALATQGSGNNGATGGSSSFGSLRTALGGGGGVGRNGAYYSARCWGGGGGMGDTCITGAGGGAGVPNLTSWEGLLCFEIQPFVLGTPGAPSRAGLSGQVIPANPGVNGYGAGGGGASTSWSINYSYAGQNAGEGALSNANGTNAAANFGGGGGGSAYQGGFRLGGNGGSGICIIKYWSAA